MMVLYKSVPVKCDGLNHMDFTADGRYAIATCEDSSLLIKLDVTRHKVISYLSLGLTHSHKSARPQDIRLSPDGRLFYVADMMMDGVFLVAPIAFRQIDFITTGKGTHSIYPSRNGKVFYIINRDAIKCNIVLKEDQVA